MRAPSRKWRWLALAAALLVAAFFAVRTWVVPALIAQQIRAHYGGKVVIGGWWLGWDSAGVTGVKLSETPGGETPPWLSADRISTDVSLSRLLHGKVMPTRIEIDRPSIDFKLDAQGKPITKILIIQPKESAAKAGPGDPLPEIVIKGGDVKLAQEGRPAFTLRGVDGRLKPGINGSDLEVTTGDPTWGKVAVTGHLDPTFQNGKIEVATGPGFVADPARLATIPFVPADVLANIEPRGPVDARVDLTLAAKSPKPISVHTELTLKGVDAKLKPLQAETTETTGKVVIDDALVRIEGLEGKTIDGTIAVNGTLDFGRKVPRADLDVRLKGIDVTKAPASWQLGEVGATGRLSGRVDLKLALDKDGPDLAGTAGRAVIEDGSFQGIPIKSLNLGLKADGNDLQYETLPEGSVDKNHLEAPSTPSGPPGALAGPGDRPAPPVERFEIPEQVIAALPVVELASHGQGLIAWAAYAVKEAVAYQVKHATTTQKGKIRLPKSITTRIELADVDLRTLVDKAKKFGVDVPVPVAGLFSIKAVATIPLGSLKDVRGYGFVGDATLKAASIDHVDLGLVATHVDLSNGVLTLSDFRGQFVDHPAGGVVNPPRATANIASAGPLPPGAFRGELRAAIAPRGGASVRFEGERLPLGEVFAPLLPVPTPLSGDATLRVEAKVDLAKVADPKSWELDGHVDSRRIKYLAAVLDSVTARAHVKDGRADVPEFAAKLLGRPLLASGQLELAPPYRYVGGIRVEGWEIAEVVKLVPSGGGLPPLSGVVDAKGEASGALQPFAITTKGAARVLGAKAGSAPIGNLGFQWKTDADAVVVDGLELYAFGGKATGQGRIPTKPGEPVRASVDLHAIDAARVSAAFLPKGPTLSGKADGHLDLTMPLDASRIDGRAKLDSTELTIREGDGPSVAVRSLLVQAVARDGALDYEATAEGLGGKVRFKGSGPLAKDLAKSVVDGEILAVGFRIGDAWKVLGRTDALSKLDGLAAFDANIKAPVHPFQLYGRGQFEVRDLRYGDSSSLGGFKGVASLTPTAWKIEQFQGELLGGVIGGGAHGQGSAGGSREIDFDFLVDRASLARMARLVPPLAHHQHEIEGFANLRVAGRVGEAIHANAEVLVPRARVLGLAVTDLRLPVEVEMVPATGSGSIHSRHWTARLAGGSIKGSAWNRFGQDRSFQADVQLAAVDVEALSRFHPIGKRPPTGKVSGKITLQGPDAEKLDKLRGRVDLNLDDASLFEMPLFKELDKFLGSSGGGLFDDGNVQGTIFNRTLFLDQMTLSGKIVQMHATGSITFNGGLNLEVLVNTNAIISGPELAVLNLVPGVGQALGVGEEAFRRVANVLENSLLKFRVSGTTSNPHVQIDPGVSVGSTAVGFFSSFIKPPGR